MLPLRQPNAMSYQHAGARADGARNERRCLSLAGCPLVAAPHALPSRPRQRFVPTAYASLCHTGWASQLAQRTTPMRNDLTIYDRAADRWWSDELRWVRTLKNRPPHQAWMV